MNAHTPFLHSHAEPPTGPWVGIGSHDLMAIAQEAARRERVMIENKEARARRNRGNRTEGWR